MATFAEEIAEAEDAAQSAEKKQKKADPPGTNNADKQNDDEKKQDEATVTEDPVDDYTQDPIKIMQLMKVLVPKKVTEDSEKQLKSNFGMAQQRRFKFVKSSSKKAASRY